MTVQLVLKEEYNFELRFRGVKRHKRFGALISPTLMYANDYGLRLAEEHGQKQFTLVVDRAQGLHFIQVD